MQFQERRWDEWVKQGEEWEKRWGDGGEKKQEKSLCGGRATAFATSL